LPAFFRRAIAKLTKKAADVGGAANAFDAVIRPPHFGFSCAPSFVDLALDSLNPLRCVRSFERPTNSLFLPSTFYVSFLLVGEGYRTHLNLGPGSIPLRACLLVIGAPFSFPPIFSEGLCVQISVPSPGNSAGGLVFTPKLVIFIFPLSLFLFSFFLF